MDNVGNFLGYQAVWLIAVYGAGAGHAWRAVVAGLGYAAWQLARSRVRITDLRLIGTALALGAALDGILRCTRLLWYATATPAAPAGGAPLWILVLWAAFACTLNHSMRWITTRLWLAAVLGALGGPLAYLGAQRLADAVRFSAPQWRGLAALGAGWGLALVLLSLVLRRSSAPPVPSPVRPGAAS